MSLVILVFYNLVLKRSCSMKNLQEAMQNFKLLENVLISNNVNRISAKCRERKIKYGIVGQLSKHHANMDFNMAERYVLKIINTR
jgi:hypothetical protein